MARVFVMFLLFANVAHLYYYIISYYIIIIVVIIVVYFYLYCLLLLNILSFWSYRCFFLNYAQSLDTPVLQGSIADTTKNQVQMQRSSPKNVKG
jgi:hypothetical protein